METNMKTDTKKSSTKTVLTGIALLAGMAVAQTAMAAGEQNEGMLLMFELCLSRKA